MKRLALVCAAFVAVMALLLPTVALAVDPVALEPPWDPEDHLTVPAATPLYVPAGWITAGRGLAMKAPQVLDWYFTIEKHTTSGSQVVARVTLAESDAYWLSGVVPAVDAYPEAADYLPFNPRMGTALFAKQWRYDIADGLPAGEYTFKSGCMQDRNAFDLLMWYEGQKAPIKLEAGLVEMPDWDFTVE